MGVLNVLENLRELGFRRQAVVYGNDDVSLFKKSFTLILGQHVTTAHDQRAWMNPHNDWPEIISGKPIDVGLDRGVADCLVHKCLLGRAGLSAGASHVVRHGDSPAIATTPGIKGDENSAECPSRQISWHRDHEDLLS